ncbi:hypothetical protein AGMMS49992_28450 [Clostridia bacterium]|nr:hypothetical protein AGMMS49992_28450 [Clostridia bacterium]
MSKVREVLNDCRKTCLEVDNLIRARKVYHLRHGPVMACTSPEPHEGTPDNMPLHRRLSVLDHLDALYEQRLCDCALRAIAVEEMLTHVTDPRDKSILREYYVIGSSIKSISITTQFNRSNVIHWKECAVQELERKYP